MHRAAIESIFGLRLGAHELSFTPCLPSHWPRAELTLRRDGRTLRFILMRADARVAGACAPRQPWAARLLLPGQALDWPRWRGTSCFVIPLTDERGAADGSAAPAASTRQDRAVLVGQDDLDAAVHLPAA